MNDHPIEQQLRDAMNAVADVLAETFAGKGFALLVFPLNANDGLMNWISNADRADMITAMKEFIANSEGRVHAAPETKQ